MCVASQQLQRFVQFSRAGAGVLLGWLFACTVAAAQPRYQSSYQPNYQFDHWTTDDGLPQNGVNALRQTRDGYLWLATFDGLVRFDGARFTVFNKGNTRGIGSNRFTALLEDRHGALWAVTDEGWLVKYQAGVFTTYTPKDGLPPWPVQQVEADEAGNLEIIARQGIAQWKDGRFVPRALKELLPAAAGVSEFTGNGLWQLGADGLRVYAQGRLTTYSTQAGLPSLDIKSVCEDQHGNIWINTKDAGLVRVKDGHFTIYPLQKALPVSFLAHEDRQGNIWLSGADHWLGRWKDGRLTRYTSAASAMAFYEDREGNFWIGTTQGLYRARAVAITTFTRRDGLSSDNIYSIYEDRAGQIWFGAWGGGVTSYKNGCVTHYRKQDGLASDDVTALYEDRDGHMWIGTTVGLHRLNRAAASACRREVPRLRAYPAPKGLFRGGVWAIQQDRAGRFWFGTSHGLVKYEDGRYTRYTSADGLAGNDVKAILEDRAGQLWCGTWGGLSRLVEGRFRSYTEQDGVASDHIRTLYEDGAGVLWIGTYDGGLTRFKDGRFTRYTTKDGLFNNGVFQILEDGRGYFWMSCNKGIYRVARQELNDFADGQIRSIKTIAYGKDDGLLSVEGNGGRQPAGWKTRDGRLWFPTAHGAAVIDPSRIELNRQPPPVVIEEVRLDNQAVPPSETIVIPPDKNNSLEIRYQGLSFIRSEQQRYKYRLEGIDQNWIEAGSRRAAYYNKLPPGSYTFTVLAANSDHAWNMQGARRRVQVRPSFWQTWWFKGSVLAGILTLALLVLRRRRARLQREQATRDAHARQLIDAQERDRQRIAGDLHDSTGQMVNLISHYALDGLGEPDNYDLVTEHFAKIAALAGEAVKELRAVAYNLRPPELDRLGLTRALQALVDRFNNLPAITFTCDVEQIDAAFGDDGKVHLYRIVQESLNNVVHHAQATEARLVIARQPSAVRIEIRDNGRGFDAAIQANGAGNRPGLGLSGITERARLLGGKAEIHSAPGQGTQIIVIITLPEMKS